MYNIKSCWAWYLVVILLLYVPLLLIAAKRWSNQSPSNWALSSYLPNPKQVSSVMFACVWQVLWRHPAFHPEVRLFLLSHSRLISLPPELLHWPVLTSHPFCLGENTTSKPHPLLFFLGFFCLDYFLSVFFLLFLSCSWTFGCVLGLCVSPCLCVLSSCLRWLRFLCRQMQHLARAA